MGELFLLLALMQAAQPPADKDKPKYVPRINILLEKDFYKAQSQVNLTQLLLERSQEFKNHEEAQKKFEVIIEKLGKECGTEYQVALDENGEIICQETPKQPAAKPPAKAP